MVTFCVINIHLAHIVWSYSILQECTKKCKLQPNSGHIHDIVEYSIYKTQPYKSANIRKMVKLIILMIAMNLNHIIMSINIPDTHIICHSMVMLCVFNNLSIRISEIKIHILIFPRRMI